MLVTNSAGTQGYVYREDLVPPVAKGPAEAIKQQEADGLDPARSVVMYESDGKTRIGTFEIGGADGSNTG